MRGEEVETSEDEEGGRTAAAAAGQPQSELDQVKNYIRKGHLFAFGDVI